MKTQALILAAFFAFLGAQSIVAQVDLATRAPTWRDFENLAHRLDALEQENQQLRLELDGQALFREASTRPSSGVERGDVWEEVEQNTVVSGAVRDCGCRCFPCQCPLPSAPCIECPHVSTLNPNFNLRIFGSLTGEALFAESRPIIPSGIILISPNLGQDTKTFEAHAKSSSLGVAFTGPKFGGYQVGGTFLSYAYGETFQADQYGLYVVRAFAELKSESTRIALGLNGDVINPRAPETLNFNAANGAGNLGFFRGQFLVENSYALARGGILTTQFAISDPVATSFADFDRVTPGMVNLLEDNGWPNLEGRLLIALGESPATPGRPHPFEFGISGLAGQLRRTDLPTNRIHDVWAFGLDAHIELTESIGINGEFFTGKAIGNYNASIVQVDNGNFSPVRSTGGWGDVYLNWTPCLHSHIGYAIDDPLNSTLTAGLPTRNEVAFANVIWDVNSSLEVGFEISRWETSYTAPVPDNDAMVYHTRVRVKF